MLNSFLQNTVEDWRNILLFIRLKETFTPSNLRVLVKQKMFVNKLSKTLSYLHQCLVSKCSYILEYTSSFPSAFTTNITCKFQISFKAPFATGFSRYTLHSLFDQSFEIAVVFQNKHFVLFCRLCQVFNICTCTELQSLTRHIFLMFSQLSRTKFC